MSASICAREAVELGAKWHGISRAGETIVGADPWRTRPQTEMSEFDSTPEDWTWSTPVPEDWRPAVEHNGSSIDMIFYTFDPVGTQRLIRNHDKFPIDSFAFTPVSETIAQGPMGSVF